MQEHSRTCEVIFLFIVKGYYEQRKISWPYNFSY